MQNLAVTILLLTAPVAAHGASSSELINQGEYVARAGDCIVCHTVPGEKPFAGGLKMGTPVGPIYTTNITPDSETGIGTYTFAEFDWRCATALPRMDTACFPPCLIRPTPT